MLGWTETLLMTLAAGLFATALVPPFRAYRGLILGGALLPLLQGHIADLGNLQSSYLVPLVAYAYVAFYGWKGHKIGRRPVSDRESLQGIS